MMERDAMLTGRCHCGAIHFRVPDETVHSSICHCTDCRGQSGAPIVAWAMIPASALAVEGEPTRYASSDSGRRSFCATCGTGLFFSNAALDAMGMIQVRIAALDDPAAIRPAIQVQTADRIAWMTTAGDLPAFERFPG
jgi:hypothetical protein